MRTSLLKHFRTSIAILIMMTLLTGVAYPLVVTAVARAAFPRQAGGSLIRANERVIGSELIGQPFSRPEYFWGRPSATGEHPYNAAASSGSNLGPSNPELRSAVANRVATLRAASPSSQLVPVDLVTASASGLDPHISPAAAEYQIDRVAVARHVTSDAVRQLVRRHVEGRQWGLLGEPRVNVLKLNLALDRELPRISQQGLARHARRTS